MANTFAPNGFQQLRGSGSAPTFEQTVGSISSSNTSPIFFGDPVTQATGATGLGTGYLIQGYGPVLLTVGATGIATTSAGVLTVTFSAAASASNNLPTNWAPPVGSTIVITGSTATSANLNGAYTVTSASTTTAVIANSGATISATSTASGTVEVFVPVAGIFTGCRYLSVANKYPAWRNYWPGSDANGDVTGYFVTDPNAQFSVMSGSSAAAATNVVLASVGQNIGFSYNQSGVTTTNGNTANGISTMFADKASLIGNLDVGAAGNAFLPFRIIGLQNATVGATSPLISINGYDSTSPYNRIIVGFNNAMSKSFAGI